MLHLRPASVRTDLAEVGDTRSLGEVLPLMREGGVSAVSANGVLGDPRRATAEHGAAVLAAMVDGRRTPCGRGVPGAGMSAGTSSGRVVLVTGAARGIGAATVDLLAERGHAVLALDACAGEGPGRPAGVEYPLAVRADLDAVVARHPDLVAPLGVPTSGTGTRSRPRWRAPSTGWDGSTRSSRRPR